VFLNKNIFDEQFKEEGVADGKKWQW